MVAFYSCFLHATQDAASDNDADASAAWVGIARGAQPVAAAVAEQPHPDADAAEDRHNVCV